MTNVCFAGVTGWTAPPILAAIDAADDLTWPAGVSRSAAGQTLAEATGVPKRRVHLRRGVRGAAAAEVDVLVDYTSAAAVKENVLTAVDAGAHVVVGSSGLTADDYAELERLARDRGVGVIAAGNFSIMAAILRRAAATGRPASRPLGDPRLRQRRQRPMCPAAPHASSPRPWLRYADRRRPRAAVAVARPDRGTRRRGGRHPNPLRAAAQLRGHHRDRLRWGRGAARHAP